MVAVNNMKTKVDSFVTSQKLNRSDATKAGHSDPYDLQDNKMVSEGAQTSVHYYNQEVEDKSEESKEDGLYIKKKTRANLHKINNKIYTLLIGILAEDELITTKSLPLWRRFFLVIYDNYTSITNIDCNYVVKCGILFSSLK